MRFDALSLHVLVDQALDVGGAIGHVLQVGEEVGFGFLVDREHDLFQVLGIVAPL